MAASDKYIAIERERKFLLSPDSTDLQSLPFKIITDKYLANTSLRLRKVVDGDDVAYKLTKKGNPNNLAEAAITTIYLDSPEYDILLKADGIVISKTRFLKTIDKVLIGIDRYANSVRELLIAEVEFSTLEEMNSFEMPLPFLREVTFDRDYNGFELAKLFGIQ